MPQNALFAGDGGSDEHEGARRLGMRSVMVTGFAESPWPDRPAARRAKADWAVRDVAELAERVLAETDGGDA